MRPNFFSRDAAERTSDHSGGAGRDFTKQQYETELVNFVVGRKLNDGGRFVR